MLLSTEDAITKSFFDFLGQNEVVELMKTNGEDVKKQDILTLKKPEANDSYGMIWFKNQSTNVAFLTNYATILPFFSSKTVISGIIPTRPG